MSTKLRRTVVRGLAVAAAGVVIAALGAACGGAGFDPKSKVDSVRLFAARADKPYAKPGDTVSLEVLAFDGRPSPARPMRHYFLPFVCLNPPADQYFGCFLPGVLASPDGGVPSRDAGAGAGGQGASGGLLADVPDGTDLTPVLVQGTRYSYKVPDSAVIARSCATNSPICLFMICWRASIELIAWLSRSAIASTAFLPAESIPAASLVNCEAVSRMASLVWRSRSLMPCIWPPNKSRIWAVKLERTSVSILLIASP